MKNIGPLTKFLFFKDVSTINYTRDCVNSFNSSVTVTTASTVNSVRVECI